MVRSMVFASGLPMKFLGDAAEYTDYILNQSPTKANDGGVSPIELLTMKKPNLSEIIAFCSTSTVHWHTNNESLGARGKAAIIIGKTDESNRYRVYLPRESVVVVTQHVKKIGTQSTMQHERTRRSR